MKRRETNGLVFSLAPGRLRKLLHQWGIRAISIRVTQCLEIPATLGVCGIGSPIRYSTCPIVMFPRAIRLRVGVFTKIALVPSLTLVIRYTRREKP